MAGTTFRGGLSQVVPILGLATYAAGTAYHVEDLFGVSLNDKVTGQMCNFETAGIHYLPATTAEDWLAGAKLYWHTVNGKLTDIATGAVFCGYAVDAKVATTQTSSLLLIAQSPV